MKHLPLDICERLRDAGYEQSDSYFVWVDDPIHPIGVWRRGEPNDQFIAAACPTLDEMLDWLLMRPDKYVEIHAATSVSSARLGMKMKFVNANTTKLAVAALVEDTLKHDEPIYHSETKRS